VEMAASRGTESAELTRVNAAIAELSRRLQVIEKAVGGLRDAPAMLSEIRRAAEPQSGRKTLFGR
jgi:hypothetical protein